MCRECRCFDTESGSSGRWRVAFRQRDQLYSGLYTGTRLSADGSISTIDRNVPKRSAAVNAGKSIAHVARDGGYDTAYVGKWHLDGGRRWDFTPPGPRRQGFDRWHAINCDHRDYLAPIYYQENDPQPIRPDRYSTDWETDVALDLFDQLTGPWCLFLSWSPPHNPYHQLPDRWIGAYDPDLLKLSANTEDTDVHRRDLAGYYTHIGALDECLGRLLDGLEHRGLTENTIVVFTSDHGDMLGAHGRYRKQWPWDESANVPLLVRWPRGLPQGEVCSAPPSARKTRRRRYFPGWALSHP